jgi:hypothetical protein
MTTSRTVSGSFAAAALAAAAMIFAVPAEARLGGGGFHGGMGGFHGSMGMHHGFGGGMGGFRSAGFMPRPFVHRPFISHRVFHRPFFVHRHHHVRSAFALAVAFPLAYAADCVAVRKRVINPWGVVVIKKRVVCV